MSVAASLPGPGARAHRSEEFRLKRLSQMVLAAPDNRGATVQNRETVGMISHAKANFQGISPRKARIIIDLVRGRSATEALQLLDFTYKAGVPFVKKLLSSALANAQQKRPGIDVDTLYVSRASVDQGPNQHMRRWRPRAMGRATRVAKGVSHIHLELDER
jgi:large subunit ribosomal protein L22